MSWQAYIDTSLVGTHFIDKAAIFAAAGDSVWATSKDFTVDPQEMKAIVSAYTTSAGRDAIWANGIRIGGAKYVATHNEGRSIYGAKGKEGIIIVKTMQALLVAHHPENVATGNAVATVEKLADYLVSVQY